MQVLLTMHTYPPRKAGEKGSVAEGHALSDDGQLRRKALHMASFLVNKCSRDLCDTSHHCTDAF